MSHGDSHPDSLMESMRTGGEVGMNAVEVYEKAVHDLEHNKINLGQFEQRIKPLKDVEPTRAKAKWVRPVPGD